LENFAYCLPADAGWKQFITYYAKVLRLGIIWKANISWQHKTVKGHCRRHPALLDGNFYSKWEIFKENGEKQASSIMTTPLINSP